MVKYLSTEDHEIGVGFLQNRNEMGYHSQEIDVCLSKRTLHIEALLLTKR